MNFLQNKRSFLIKPYTRLRESLYETLQAYFRPPQSHLQASTKCRYVSNTRPFSNGTSPSQLRTNCIGIKWRTWSRLERTALATRGYNVYIHLQIFCSNLDESREWPQCHQKVGILAKGGRFPSLYHIYNEFHDFEVACGVGSFSWYKFSPEFIGGYPFFYFYCTGMSKQNHWLTKTNVLSI